MKLLSCRRAPDAKRGCPPATAVAGASSPSIPEAGAAPRHLSSGGQVGGGPLGPNRHDVAFLQNGSRCSWADLDSSNDDRLVVATVKVRQRPAAAVAEKRYILALGPAAAIGANLPRKSYVARNRLT